MLTQLWYFKDPQLSIGPKVIPKDTSMASILAEQCARLAIKLHLDSSEHKAVGCLQLVIDRPVSHLIMADRQDDMPRSTLIDGSFTYLKQYAMNSERICSSTYLLPALPHPKTGGVLE